MFASSGRRALRCVSGERLLIVTAVVGAFFSGCGGARAPTAAPSASTSTNTQPAVPIGKTSESSPASSGIAKAIAERSAGPDSHELARFVPEDACLMSLFRPRRIVNSPLAKGVPPWFWEKTAEGELPVDLQLTQIDWILGVLVPDRRLEEDPAYDDEGRGIRVFRTVEPMDEVRLVGRGQPAATRIREARRAGRRYWRLSRVEPDEPDDPTRTNILLWLDDKTLITGNEAIVLDVLSGVRAGPMTGRLRDVSLDQDLVIVGLPSTTLTQFVRARAKVAVAAEVAEQLKAAVDQARSIQVTVNPGGGDLASISIDAASEDAANSMFARMTDSREKLEGMYETSTAGFRGDDASSIQKELTAFADKLLVGLSMTKTGKRVAFKVGKPGGWEELAVTLKPVLEQAEAAAKESWRFHYMREIVLAFHEYHRSNGSFPPKDPSRRGLSWRVHLLADLGERDLFAKFKLDEPWDSEHNKALIDQMPKIYASSDVKEPGRTRFLGYSGEGAPHGRERGLTFTDFVDGESQTILIVEVAPEKAMIWTQPDDLKFDPKDPKAALGNLTADTFLAAFVDGSVRRLSKDIKPETLKAMITYAGGESPSDGP